MSSALEELTNGSERRRVVVTGMGAVTGRPQRAGDLASAGRRALGRRAGDRCLIASPYPARIAAEVKDFDPVPHLDPKEARRMARCSQLAIVAAREAVVDAGLDWAEEDRERVGVILGTGIGGIELLVEPLGRLATTGVVRTTPHAGLESLCNMPAFHVGLDHGCLGPLSTVVTACAAGTQAIGDAMEMIRRGTTDIMLAGGVDAQVTPLMFGGFSALRAFSTHNDEPQRACRPFDADA